MTDNRITESDLRRIFKEELEKFNNEQGGEVLTFDQCIQIMSLAMSVRPGENTNNPIDFIKRYKDLIDVISTYDSSQKCNCSDCSCKEVSDQVNSLLTSEE